MSRIRNPIFAHTRNSLTTYAGVICKSHLLTPGMSASLYRWQSYIEVPWRTLCHKKWHTIALHRRTFGSNIWHTFSWKWLTNDARLRSIKWTSCRQEKSSCISNARTCSGAFYKQLLSRVNSKDVRISFRHKNKLHYPSFSRCAGRLEVLKQIFT